MFSSTNIQVRVCYPSNIPSYEISNPFSVVDLESCSGVDANASCINVGELWFEPQPTAVPAPPRSRRLVDFLGGYSEHHYSVSADLVNYCLIFGCLWVHCV